jgi:UDP-2-acetamido-2,6-beta-L-arabino-hexul-4-ose reductase
METTCSKPHILMASSTQESMDNPYGKSKLAGRKLFIDWAAKNNGSFTGMVIPNVFGPFGKPYYNSVIANFCYQLIHNETPQINIDKEVSLIYIQDLLEVIYNITANNILANEYRVKHDFSYKVSDILKRLKEFHDNYYENGIFPEVDNYFDLCLFNTYRSFLDHEYYPRLYNLHPDERGVFSEVIRSLGQGQVSFSITKPGITRGNHFHLRKIERFAVIKGEAIIQLRRIGTEKIIEYKLSGDKPGYVDMPVWYTHNIKNTGSEDLYTLFWTNEFYDENNTDTYFELV